MNNKRVLITGCQGFIGSNLARWIKQLYPQARISGTVRKSRTMEGQEIVDLTEKKDVQKLIEKTAPDYIFHLAGILYAKGWEQYYEGNIKTSINILEALKTCGLHTKIVLLGSAAEYGNVDMKDLPLTEEQPVKPVSLYGLSKACQTQAAHYYCSQGLNIVTARLFNVFGRGISRELSIGSFLYQIEKIVSGEELPILATGNLEAYRDYLFVADVCSALVCLAENGVSGEIYNVCAGSSVSMKWIVDQMIKNSGIKIEVRIDSSKYKPIDVENIYGSFGKLANVGGWKPCVALEDGIARMMKLPASL